MRLQEALGFLGIWVLDHLAIGRQQHTRLAAMGWV
ncbi:hypothetical protein EYC57_03520 [Xanthomonas oryzae]|nr:hypothetical protein EYC57_03520 [Xanthomonas oryzae]